MLRCNRRKFLLLAASLAAEKGVCAAWKALQGPNAGLDGSPWHPDAPYNRSDPTHIETLDRLTREPQRTACSREQFEALSLWARTLHHKDRAFNCMVFCVHPAEFRLWLLGADRMYTYPICNINNRQSAYNLRDGSHLHTWVPSLTLDFGTRRELLRDRHYTPAALYRLIGQSHNGDNELNGVAPDANRWAQATDRERDDDRLRHR